MNYMTEQKMSPQEAAELLGLLRQADDAWFVDRSKHFINMDMDGRPAKYDCMLEDSCPPEIQAILDRIRPLDTDELIVNRYKEGMSIPRHHDGCVSPKVSCITLEDTHDVVRLHDGKETWSVPDKAGQMYTISSATEHSVLSVKSERFSIIILRGMMNDY